MDYKSVIPCLKQSRGHMQNSMRNSVTPKLKLTLTLTLTLIDTGGAVLTLMLGYRSLYITWQQHHNGLFCRIVCKLSLRILICILPCLKSPKGASQLVTCPKLGQNQLYQFNSSPSPGFLYRLGRP